MAGTLNVYHLGMNFFFVRAHVVECVYCAYERANEWMNEWIRTKCFVLLCFMCVKVDQFFTQRLSEKNNEIHEEKICMKLDALCYTWGHGTCVCAGKMCTSAFRLIVVTVNVWERTTKTWSKIQNAKRADAMNRRPIHDYATREENRMLKKKKKKRKIQSVLKRRGPTHFMIYLKRLSCSLPEPVCVSLDSTSMFALLPLLSAYSPLQADIKKYPHSVISRLKSKCTTGLVCPLQVSGICRKLAIFQY